MSTSLRAIAFAGLVACGGAAASAPADEAASPFEPITAPAATILEPIADDGGDVCAFDQGAPPPPCDRRQRFGRPNRVYVGEIDVLERLLAETPAGTRDHEVILMRVASDYLDLACIAFAECVRGGVTREAARAGDTARAAAAKLGARCERYRREYQREPDASVCP